MRLRVRLRLVAPLLLVTALGACQGGSNAGNPVNPNGANPNEATPSALPPGYRPRIMTQGGQAPTDVPGQELDVKLAVVEGEVITRRRLVREAGPRAPGQSEAAYERSLHNSLLERARLLIFVREAQRSGIRIPAQTLDEVMADQIAKEVKEATETTGRPVTVQEYLAERRMTKDEYRERLREQAMFDVYVRKLERGWGPEARPQVDMEVTPAEVRRIYWSNPGAFDMKPGVRFLVFQVPVETYLVGDAGFLDAEEKAQEVAKGIAEALRRGEAPAAVARRYELADAYWQDSKGFIERQRIEEGMGSDAAAWLFDPARRPKEATVLAEAVGPLVLGVVEVQAAERVPYEKAYPQIVGMIGLVRRARLIEERLIEILSSRNVVQPESLADELLANAQGKLDEMRRDPVVAAMRFR